MELPGTAYLYNLSMLAMTFTGFSVIVMILRQALGHKVVRYDLLLAHVFMEFGLIIVAVSLLPPLFAIWGLPATTAWRLSSAMAALPLFVYIFTYPMRRRFASGESTPPFYVWISLSIVFLIGLCLAMNATGLFHIEAGAAFLTAMTAFLVYAAGSFLHGLTILLLRSNRGQNGRGRK
jgi:hypothetical protein